MQSWFLGYMDGHSGHLPWLNYGCKIKCLHIAPSKNPNLVIWAPFSSVCNSYIILHFCIQLYVPCLISFYCESNITFLAFFSPNHEFNPILFLQISAPNSGRGSTSRVLVRYNILTEETLGHIRATGFEPVIRLMLERSANAVLAQTLAEWWWDATHTFHIANWETTITPHDFHHMTSLWFDRVPISLED